MSADAGKRAAAEAAAALVEDGMLLGIGTGSTVAFLIPAVAARGLDVTCVATSPASAQAATALGLRVVDFEGITRLDLAIDGADQVAPDWWLVKGGGAAHTREKIVESSADRLLVIVDASKTVEAIRAPIPLEIVPFGADATIARIEARTSGRVVLRDVPRSPDGGIIADLVDLDVDPGTLSATLSETAGVVEHGLFAPTMVSAVVVGDVDGTVRWLSRS